MQLNFTPMAQNAAYVYACYVMLDTSGECSYTSINIVVVIIYIRIVCVYSLSTVIENYCVKASGFF